MARFALLALFALVANAVCLPKCIAQPHAPVQKAPPCHQHKAPQADADCAHPQVADLEKAASVAVAPPEIAFELPAAPVRQPFRLASRPGVTHYSPPAASITVLRV